MAKEDFEDDDFSEEEEMSFDDEEEEPQPKKLENRGKPKREETIKDIKKAVSEPTVERKATQSQDDDYFVFEQPARIGIGKKSTNKSVGENDALLAGALVEILNKLERIEKNTG